MIQAEIMCIRALFPEKEAVPVAAPPKEEIAAAEEDSEAEVTEEQMIDRMVSAFKKTVSLKLPFSKIEGQAGRYQFGTQKIWLKMISDGLLVAVKDGYQNLKQFYKENAQDEIDKIKEEYVSNFPGMGGPGKKEASKPEPTPEEEAASEQASQKSAANFKNSMKSAWAPVTEIEKPEPKVPLPKPKVDKKILEANSEISALLKDGNIDELKGKCENMGEDQLEHLLSGLLTESGSQAAGSGFEKIKRNFDHTNLQAELKNLEQPETSITSGTFESIIKDVQKNMQEPKEKAEKLIMVVTAVSSGFHGQNNA